jgi:small subunit ribosomal protein S27e
VIVGEIMSKIKSKFLKVHCRDCGNEQIMFDRATSVVNCNVCGSTLARPSGGKAHLTGATVAEVLE